MLYFGAKGPIPPDKRLQRSPSTTFGQPGKYRALEPQPSGFSAPICPTILAHTRLLFDL